MSTPPPSDRLSDYFQYLATVSPAALKVWAASGEADFGEAVGEALDEVLEKIKKDAALARREPGLGRRLVHLLSAAAVPCGAEEGHDGHVNVTVKHPAELAFTIRKAVAAR